MNIKTTVILFIYLSFSNHAGAQERLRMATTTSTDNSGLLAVLNPPFEQANNIKVDVIAVGTGKALRLGMNGDVDLVFVHAPAAEMKFINDGYGIERLPVMHNDFVLLGPITDPANTRAADSIADALVRIANTKLIFISRGDDSGTHKKEKSLWQAASIDPIEKWYLSAGQGMGAVLKIANDKQAYTLADRGTYLAYKDKMDLTIVYEGAPELYNPYHIIIVNPEKHPHVKLQSADKYTGFVRSETGQMIIREFKVSGEQLFHPDVIKQ
jgi:tungstate transport system substrate-binding protein